MYYHSFSLLDQDLYKLTMHQAVFFNFPSVEVEYRLINRGKQKLGDLVLEINDLLKYESGVISFTESDINFLSKLRFFKKPYLDYLKNYRLNADLVKITRDNATKDMCIKIEGLWLDTILFEVILLSMISGEYSKRYEAKFDKYYENGKRVLEEKLDKLKGTKVKFVDFGTRRRFNCFWHEKVLETIWDWEIKNHYVLIGTSNLFFAKEYDMKPIGTMAHEWLQAGQAMNVRLDRSQEYMLQKWSETYRGDLGIALTDVIGMDAFLKDFDLYFAKLFDGCRHDSGDPYTWCNKLIEHYEKLGISPWTKTAVFSDGLDFDKMIDLHETFSKDINVSFGIGTNLTNDLGFPEVEPLKIVIKMVKCNGKPVVKISDEPSKTMSPNSLYVNYLKSVFKCKK